MMRDDDDSQIPLIHSFFPFQFIRNNVNPLYDDDSPLFLLVFSSFKCQLELKKLYPSLSLNRMSVVRSQTDSVARNSFQMYMESGVPSHLSRQPLSKRFLFQDKRKKEFVRIEGWMFLLHLFHKFLRWGFEINMKEKFESRTTSSWTEVAPTESKNSHEKFDDSVESFQCKKTTAWLIPFTPKILWFFCQLSEKRICQLVFPGISCRHNIITWS
jgi:hypothetical protein